jgi:hypothetical protein
LFSRGPAICKSFLSKPASRKRFAIASAALVTLPTESVVLISINSLKISRARRWYSCGASVLASLAANDGGAAHVNETATAIVPSPTFSVEHL